MTTERKHSQQALGQIEKQFGKGSVMRLGDGSAAAGYGGRFDGLDRARRGPGHRRCPRGGSVEIYGPESSGKTTLTLQAMAEAQKAGGTAAFVDAEHALDPIYAEKLGVNVDELLVLAAGHRRAGARDHGHAGAFGRRRRCRRRLGCRADTPKAEIEGEMGDSHVGLQARLMSQALRKLTGNIKRSNTMVVFINQIRMKIGVMFGSPETTTGGNALKFYSSVRLDIRRIGAIKKGDEVIGNQTRVKVVKNKVSPPFKHGGIRDSLRRGHLP